MQGMEASAAVTEQGCGILGRTHLSGNWHDLVPKGREQNPMAPGPSGPLCLCLSGRAPDAPVNLSSSSLTRLLAIPRTHPALCCLLGLVPGICFCLECPFPSVQIILQGPCPDASSTRKPPQGLCAPASPYPLPILSLLKVCPGLFPWPGGRYRKGEDSSNPSVPLPPPPVTGGGGHLS